MNPPVVRLYALLLALLVAVVGFTSNWAVFEADELRARPDNRRPLIEEQQIPRGEILTSDGLLVAESLPQGQGQQQVFVRSYPQGTLFGHAVGYSFVDVGRSGIELSEDDLLAGRENEFVSILDQLRGEAQEGADLTLTIDAGAQRVATQALASAAAIGNGRGAVVAIEPSTGAVRAMVSLPGYDPNGVGENFSELNRDEGAPLLNRATQSAYPPGSTMKVVTAVAALDSGEFTPDTVLNANSGIEISGVPLANAGGANFGQIDMTTALTNSVNTYWAQVGEQLGPDTMIEYMERFGFGSDPELDYPPDQMRASGVQNADGDLVTEGFDVGRVAIGQGGEEGQLLATPIQMALVAAAVANDGVLMEPTFLERATDPDGREIEELDPDEQSRVMSDETAAQLTELMTRVTQEGTASGLTVDGVTFAGKTGTAEIDVEEGLNQAWFIGFAPADDPQVAVAVTIERCTGCFGGEVAGPVATQVMEELLR